MYDCNCEVKLLKLKANYNNYDDVKFRYFIVIARRSYLN